MSEVEGEEPNVEVKKTICWPSPGCHCNCGLLVRVKDNQILSIKGNPEFPYNRGAVCAERMPHFRQWLHHPDQLMVPLKRRRRARRESVGENLLGAGAGRDCRKTAVHQSRIRRRKPVHH